MKIIIGLGNPGEQYEKTRHNAGFMVLEKLASHPALNVGGEKLSFGLDKRLKARIAYTIHKGEKIILVKPETFMNASGIAVSKVMHYYKAELSDLVIISDDIDLPLGEVRIRAQGSSAGQKGLQNIIDELGSDKFIRVRVGINNKEMDFEFQMNQPQKLNTASFVLQTFNDREQPVIEETAAIVAENLIANIDNKEVLKSTTLKTV